MLGLFRGDGRDGSSFKVAARTGQCSPSSLFVALPLYQDTPLSVKFTATPLSSIPIHSFPWLPFLYPLLLHLTFLLHKTFYFWTSNSISMFLDKPGYYVPHMGLVLFCPFVAHSNLIHSYLIFDMISSPCLSCLSNMKS